MTDRQPMVPLRDGDRVSTTTREQVRNAPIQKNTYVSPHYGDGGWHGSSFASEAFDAEWEPRNDRILIRRLPDQSDSVIACTDLTATWQERRALILKVGPGRWIPGEWWHFYKPKPHWEWIAGHRRPMSVHPGQIVIVGPQVDWDSYSGEIALCQELDVRVVLPT